MIRAIIAFFAAILTAVQVFLIVTGGNQICLNTGCEIVDKYTKVPPLYFNIAGFLFFVFVFISLVKGRDGIGAWHRCAKLLLLAGVAVEAVLIFFQHSILETFCSYCLIIFAIIVVLNILSGLKQLITATVVFSAVIVGFLSLEFSSTAGVDMSLDDGSYAMIGEEDNQKKLYLFFSENCVHCENVISRISESEDNMCTLRFNPIENVENFSLPGSIRLQRYNPEPNRVFLKNLGIKEIPVLVAKEQDAIVIVKGEKKINQYLNEKCMPVEEVDYSGSSQTGGAGVGYLPGQELSAEGCAIEEDCDDPKVGNKQLEIPSS